METKLYSFAVFSENSVGLLSQVAIIFTRRTINIESISASTCSIEGVHKWIITAYTTEDVAKKLVKQIERCIYVIKAFYYTDDEIVHQEIALYKVSTSLLISNACVEDIIRRHGARILEINEHYTVIEKTGHKDETESLFKELKQYDLKQFVRSGRVIVTKAVTEYVSDFLKNQEKRRNSNDL